MSLITSITPVTVSLADGDGFEQVAIAGSPTTANCVPYVSKRVIGDIASNFQDVDNYALNVRFTSGDLVVERDNTDSSMSVLVYVVEYNPAEVRVQQGTFQVASGSGSLAASLGQNVVLANTYALAYSMQSTGTEGAGNHLLRARLTDVDELTLDRTGTPQGTMDGNYYVIESINGGFTTEAVDVQLGAAVTSNTGTVTAVTPANTAVFGSWKAAHPATDAADPGAAIVGVDLTDSTTVTVTRDLADSNAIDWSGWVVKFANGETVQRGSILTNVGSVTTLPEDIAISSVNTSASIAMHTGSPGAVASGRCDGTINSNWPACAGATLEITDATTLQLDHYEDASNFIDRTFDWQVIDFTQSAGPAPGRRFLVRA